MPTYNYLCPNCNHDWEAFIPISKRHKQKCPKCGSIPLKQISLNKDFILKGSGFYQNDYPKDKK